VQRACLLLLLRAFSLAQPAKDWFALKWYDSGHDLNDPLAFADRQAWLRKHLALR